MQALAIFPNRKELHIVDHNEPILTQPNQVKIKVLEVGICGTDRHLCSSYFGTTPPGSDYLILGHEALGKVVEVGSSVQRFKAGDLVVPEVRHPCQQSECSACRAGQQDFCSTYKYTERGIFSLHGYMTDFVIDDESRLHLVPPALRNVAVLVEPLTIAEKALIQVKHIQQRLPWFDPSAPENEKGHGLKAIVLGAGPIGLLGAMALVASGFETYVYSRAQTPNLKAEIVAAIGATYISSTTTTIERFANQVGKFDLVYEALDASPVALKVLPLLASNGIFVFTSQTNAHQPLGIDAAAVFSHIIQRNHVIIGTINASSEAFNAAIEDIAIFQQRWPSALQAMISHRHTLGEMPTLLPSRTDGIKHIVVLNH